MELRHLRYFVRVAEELHFGRAAMKLGISQPPLSQQVRALEEELGIDLFDRTSRRVRLTDAGALFLIEARRTLDQAEHAVAVARRIQQGEAGELAIGFATSVPFVPVVSRAFARFRADHPAIHLSLRELGRHEQIAELADARLDLGFIRNFDRPILPTGVLSSLLQEEPMMVALRDDHPMAGIDRPFTVEDIAEQPMVMFSQEAGAGFNDHLALIFARAGHELRVMQEVNGLGSMLGLVAAALGITVITRSLTALRVDRIVYRELQAPDAVSRLWLAHRQAPSLAARTFIKLLGKAEE